MKRIVTMFMAVVVVATCATLTATAIASTPNSTTTGTCYDGSKWSLTLSRSGAKVVSNFVVQPTLKNATFVVNYAYTPENKVDHLYAKSDKRGKLVANNAYYTSARTGVLVFLDNSGVMYCAAYGEI